MKQDWDTAEYVPCLHVLDLGLLYSDELPLAPPQTAIIFIHAVAGSDSGTEGGPGLPEQWGGQGLRERRTVYSAQCARIRLNGVVVKNQGIDWSHQGNVYWQHKVPLLPPLTIIAQWHFVCLGRGSTGTNQKQRLARIWGLESPLLSTSTSEPTHILPLFYEECGN
jgi:hypothetical protein